MQRDSRFFLVKIRNIKGDSREIICREVKQRERIAKEEKKRNGQNRIAIQRGKKRSLGFNICVTVHKASVSAPIIIAIMLSGACRPKIPERIFVQSYLSLWFLDSWNFRLKSTTKATEGCNGSRKMIEYLLLVDNNYIGSAFRLT